MPAPIDHGRRIAEDGTALIDSKAQVGPTEPAPRIFVRFAYCYCSFSFTRLGLVSCVFCFMRTLMKQVWSVDCSTLPFVFQ